MSVIPASVENHARERWESIQSADKYVVACDLGDGEWFQQREQPQGPADYAGLRIARRDFCWTRPDAAQRVAERGEGIVIRGGDSPFEQSPVGFSFIGGRPDSRGDSPSAMDLAREAGWEFVQFRNPGFIRDAEVLKLRTDFGNSVRFSNASTSAFWDLGPIGPKDPADPVTPLTTRQSAPEGDDVWVLVADSGLPLGTPDIFSGSDVEDVVNAVGVALPDVGHGYFIKSLIRQVTQSVKVHIFVSNVVDHNQAPLIWEQHVRHDIDEFLLGHPGEEEKLIVNCSFGGIYDGQPSDLLAFDAWMNSWLSKHNNLIFVAAAGNQGISDARWRPAAVKDQAEYPKRVVPVGALNQAQSGPAYFSNYGPWVRAWAPGENLVATIGGVKYRWSGTSFAAPVVTARLADLMVRTGTTADKAILDLHIADAGLGTGPNGGKVTLP